jgi:exopolysaccharide biosynthesis WecB/TagA/CpsF family protein
MNDLNNPGSPAKYDLFGVNVSAVDYDMALEYVMDAAKARRGMCVTHLAVHGLMEGSANPDLRAKLNGFDIVAPDGQPVRIALNLVYGTTLKDRCYGPEFTLRVCERAAKDGVGVYLYGSREEVVNAMRNNLIAKYPGLNVVAAEPSLFRPLSEEEDADLARRVNDSGAGVVFIGLGCPLQERFGYEHRSKFNAVQICVGAAFDFHAGNKKQAPSWMQRCSLEWLYRLIQEPRRLAKRYFVTNSLFLAKLAARLLGFGKQRQAS